MMRKILFLIFILSINILNAKSQSGISSGSYTQGCYYTDAGDAVKGYIYLNRRRDYIYYKQDVNSKYEKIKIDKLRAVKTFGDSTIVLTIDNNANKRYFGVAYCTTPTRKFYLRLTEYTSPGVTMFSSIPGSSDVRPPVLQTGASQHHIGGEYYYDDNGTTYKLTKGNFREILSKAMAQFPDLSFNIQNEVYKFSDIATIFGDYRERLNAKK